MRTIPKPQWPPADEASDPALCQAIAAGDQLAFGLLFQQHMQAIWNYTHRLTGSWTEAEDLTSATFLTAWRKRDRIRLVNDSALPWLYTVARNLARTQYRGKRRMLRALTRIAEPPVESDHADEVSARIDDDKQVRRLRAALPRLSAAEREAVELCLLAGLDTAAAAVLLDRAEVSIRSRLSRAKARLRTILEANS